MQDPLFSGEAGAFAYLPSQKVAISLALTFTEDAFGPDGNYTEATGANAADLVWRADRRPRGAERPATPQRGSRYRQFWVGTRVPERTSLMSYLVERRSTK